MSNVKYRDMIEADIPYIKSTFLQSFRKSPSTKYTSNTTYFGFFSPLFDHLLDKAGVIVKLAVNPEDVNHIYAWCVYEIVGPTQVLHYVYTKFAYRNFDIATSLLFAAEFKLHEPFFYTLFSRDAYKLRKKYENAVHNPFILLSMKESYTI